MKKSSTSKSCIKILRSFSRSARGVKKESSSVQNITKLSSLDGLSSWPYENAGVSSKGRGESKMAVSSSMQGVTPSAIVPTSPNSTRTMSIQLPLFRSRFQNI